MRALALSAALLSPLTAQVYPAEFTARPAGEVPFVLANSRDSVAELVVDNVPGGSYTALGWRYHFRSSATRPAFALWLRVDASQGVPTAANASLTASNCNATNVTLRASAPISVPAQASVFPQGQQASRAEPWIFVPFDTPLLISSTASNVCFRLDFAGTGGALHPYADGATLPDPLQNSAYVAPVAWWSPGPACGIETKMAPTVAVMHGQPRLQVLTDTTSLATTAIVLCLSAGFVAPYSLPVNSTSCPFYVDPNCLALPFSPAMSGIVNLPDDPGCYGATFSAAQVGVSATQIEEYTGSYAITYPAGSMVHETPGLRAIRLGITTSDWSFPVLGLF